MIPGEIYAYILLKCVNEDGSCPINIRLAGGRNLSETLPVKTVVSRCVDMPWFMEEAQRAQSFDKNRLHLAWVRTQASRGWMNHMGHTETVLKGLIDGGFEHHVKDVYDQIDNGDTYLNEFAMDRVFMHALSRGATYAMHHCPKFNFVMKCTPCVVKLTSTAVLSSADPAAVISWFFRNERKWMNRFNDQIANILWDAACKSLSLDQVDRVVSPMGDRYPLVSACAKVRARVPLSTADMEWSGWRTAGNLSIMMSEIAKATPVDLDLMATFMSKYNDVGGVPCVVTLILSELVAPDIIDALIPQLNTHQLNMIFRVGVKMGRDDIIHWCIQRGVDINVAANYYQCDTRAHIQRLRDLGAPFPPWPLGANWWELGAAYICEAPDVPDYDASMIIGTTLLLRESPLTMYRKARKRGFRWDTLDKVSLIQHLCIREDTDTLRWLVENGLRVTPKVMEIARTMESTYMADWIGHCCQVSNVQIY